MMAWLKGVGVALRPPRQGHDGDAIALLLHWVTLIVAGLTFLVGVGTVWALGATHSWPNVVVLGFVALTQLALRRGRAREAAQAFVFFLWLIITVAMILRGGTRSPLQATYFAVIATTSVLLSRRMGLLYALLSATVIGGVYLAEAAGFSSTDVYTPSLRFVVVAAALLMTGGIISLAAKLKEDAAARAVASETQYAELIRTAPEAILTVDSEGMVRSGNPAAEVLFQLGTGLVGRRLDTLPGLSALAATGTPSTASTVSSVVERSDGTKREVEVDLRPLTLLGKPGTRVSVRDVTARREAERDRARLTEQLNQIQKQESIGLLAGGIAHDFNNLITVSLLNLDVLETLQQSSECRALVQEVRGSSQRAAALTRQLLAFGRRQVLHARNVSLSAVVEGVRPMLRRLLSEDIELDCALDAKGIVRADSGQLEQVIVNLVVNARDAMPGGGTISMRTLEVELRDDRRGVPPGRYLCLRVEDTGMGISPDNLPRIFEPFFTTKGPGRGTGLGLSVVDGIVRQSGGAVTVESVEGKGTRFEVLLPRVAAERADEVEEPARTVGRSEGQVVLVIEDEPALRLVISRVLEDVGFEVLGAGDGEAALRVAADPARRIDLVVTDVVMPRLGGPEAVALLRERRPGLRALFLSGYSDRPLEALGATAPDSAFLGKPFRPDELLTGVFALLGRERATRGG